MPGFFTKGWGGMNRVATLIYGHVQSKTADYLALTKPRVVSMVLLSAFAGFYLGSAVFSPISMLAVLTATGFVAAGAMALNQYMERDLDARMHRTRERPLPAGRLEPKEALGFGILISALGFLSFLFMTNLMALSLSFLTWASYLFIYTPLKNKTSLSTIAGAVPGALPPMIGWAGANGKADFHSFLLFLIIFFWQMPHFLAIAWMYREDYARAKQPLLSVLDHEGSFVARQMILNVCALVPVSLLLAIFGLVGRTYFFGAFILGLLFSGAIIFSAASLNQKARFILRSSIIYLAAVLALMIFDKV